VRERPNPIAGIVPRALVPNSLETVIFDLDLILYCRRVTSIPRLSYLALLVVGSLIIYDPSTIRPFYFVKNTRCIVAASATFRS
jgi:hypothetical protein